LYIRKEKQNLVQKIGKRQNNMKKRKESKKNSYDATLKIVMLGDSSDLKTSVVQRYLMNVKLKDLSIEQTANEFSNFNSISFIYKKVYI